MTFLYFTARFILLNSFVKLEEKEVRRNVERVLYSFNDDLANLNSVADDWAAWDDTYSFVKDKNKEYINVNLVDSTFIGLRLNLIMFFDSHGKLIFSKVFDLKKKEAIPVPKSIRNHLSAHSLLLRHQHLSSNISGILCLEEAPMIVSSWPIRTSEETGPIRGTLIFGRYLDDNEIKRLAKKTNLSLTISRLDTRDLPLDQLKLLSSSSGNPPVTVRALSQQRIGGYTIIKDIYGTPAVLFNIYMTRDIYQRGRTSLFYFILSLTATGLVFTVVTIVLLDKQILSRLFSVNNSIINIRESGDLSLRVPMTGKDELSSLIDELNKMLEALERSDKSLRTSHEQLRALTARLSEIEESERRRLAHQLHDMVGQNLTALGINLNALSSKFIKESKDSLLDDTMRLLEDTIQSIRGVMADLRPSVLDDYGLLSAIRFYSEQFSDRSGIIVEIYGKEIKPRLSSDVETILFRIVQESLINVLKHANATKVDIILEEMDKMVRITVGDNGVGFDYETIRKSSKHLGWGLITIEERARALGGKLRVESGPGKGTRIIVEVKK